MMSRDGRSVGVGGFSVQNGVQLLSKILCVLIVFSFSLATKLFSNREKAKAAQELFWRTKMHR
jgi:hypothetical protein